MLRRISKGGFDRSKKAREKFSCLIISFFVGAVVLIVGASRSSASASDISSTTCNEKLVKGCTGLFSVTEEDARLWGTYRDGNKDTDTKICEAKQRMCSKEYSYSCLEAADCWTEQKENSRALPLVKFACEKGVAQGCIRFMAIKAEPLPSQKDFDNLTKFCSQGFKLACANRATMLFKRGDKAGSEKVFGEICGHDLPSACVNHVGVVGVLRGDTEKKTVAVRHCYEKKIDESCKILANLLEEEKDVKGLQKLHEFRCNSLFEGACSDAARLALREGDVELAERWSRLACQAWEGEGCLVHAEVLKKRNKNDPALKAMRQACDLGTQAACAGVTPLPKDVKVAEPLVANRSPTSGTTAAAKDKDSRELAKRCQSGEELACAEEARLLIVADKFAEGLSKFKEQCARGQRLSCDFIASFLGSGEHFDEIRTYAKARCLERTGKDCSLKVIIDRKRNSYIEARTLARKGCAIGEGASCKLAGYLALDRDKILEAYANFSKACDLWETDGCKRALILGKFRGVGVKELARLQGIACREARIPECDMEFRLPK